MHETHTRNGQINIQLENIVAHNTVWYYTYAHNQNIVEIQHTGNIEEASEKKIYIKAVDWENMKIAYNIKTLLLLRYTHDLHRNNRTGKK